MDNLEKEVLFENLKEYMLRTSIVFGLCMEHQIAKKEAYDKLNDIWDEYSDATMRIFEGEDDDST